MSDDKTGVRLGIIGVGAMGANHARQVSEGKIPEMVLAAVCDERASALSEFGEVPSFSDPVAMLDSGVVDAVLLATPHFSHTSLGIAVLERGLHLLVEKPISVQKADCERLLAAHDLGKGNVFAAMFNQRTDPRYRQLRTMLRSGELGAVRRIQWVITDWFRSEAYYHSSGWRATWAGEGGGVLLNQCPHQLDLWQWMFGMPQTITASCQLRRFHDIEVEDSVTALLEYEDGVQGVFVTTTGEAPGENRLSVATDLGLVTVEPTGLRWQRTEMSVETFSKTTTGSFSKPATQDVFMPTEGTGEQHLGVMKNFAAAILRGEPLLAPASEGIYSVELANAMLLSSLKGRRQSLPMDAAEYKAELAHLIGQSTFQKKETTATVVHDFAKSF